MPNRKNTRRTPLTSRWMWLTLVPLYLFTLVLVLGPLVYMLVLSFETRADMWGVIPQFTLANYQNIFQPVFWTNSLIRLYGWIIVLRSGGTLDKVLMALHLTQRPLKLLYTYPAVVVGMVYALLQFMILAVYSSAEKMDWSLVEAARDLGASPAQAFFTVTLKLTMPGLLSGVILTFIPSMGLFFIADILGGNKVVLVGSLIQDQLLQAHNWPFAAALSVVLMLLTSLMIGLYKRVTHTTRLEGLL